MAQTFHYGFDMLDDERILHKALVNMEDNDLFANGALYLTNERLVFVGYILNTRNRVSCDISLYHIKEVKPEKTFLVFNNIIRIISIRDEQYKFIVDRQKEWLEKIGGVLREIG
jgi:hypothetical protein